jgi:iron complex outermembrane receptor protein
MVRGRDRVSGEALFDMPADRLIASLRLIGAGGRRVLAPYVEVGTTLVRKQDRVPTATVYRLPTDGYALVHLEMGADAIRLLGLPIELNLAVRNLFDTAYRDYLTRYRLFVDDPGRDVVVRLTVPFGTGISR